MSNAVLVFATEDTFWRERKFQKWIQKVEGNKNPPTNDICQFWKVLKNYIAINTKIEIIFQ